MTNQLADKLSKHHRLKWRHNFLLIVDDIAAIYIDNNYVWIHHNPPFDSIISEFRHDDVEGILNHLKMITPTMIPIKDSYQETIKGIIYGKQHRHPPTAAILAIAIVDELHDNGHQDIIIDGPVITVGITATIHLNIETIDIWTANPPIIGIIAKLDYANPTLIQEILHHLGPKQ